MSMHAYMHIYIYIHTHTQTYIYTQWNTWSYSFEGSVVVKGTTPSAISRYVYVYACIYAYIHIYIHTYTNLHIYTMKYLELILWGFYMCSCFFELYYATRWWAQQHMYLLEGSHEHEIYIHTYMHTYIYVRAQQHMYLLEGSHEHEI